VLTALQQQGRVDGVIGSFYYAGLEDFLPLLARGVPVARVNGPDNPNQSVDYPIDTLVIDNIAAAREAVAHLLERGHRVIGMLAGEGPPRVDRAAGYQQALEAYGLAFDPSLLDEGPFTVETGRTGMALLLERHPELTAVFAASDMLAMGAMLTLNQRGLKIPEDVAVVGFDDIFAAELVTPPLTTVAQFQDRLGRRAAEMLMERLRGEVSSGSRYEVMPYQLIVRAST
jgi:LacI family transcriptional regulator